MYDNGTVVNGIDTVTWTLAHQETGMQQPSAVIQQAESDTQILQVGMKPLKSDTLLTTQMH